MALGTWPVSKSFLFMPKLELAHGASSYRFSSWKWKENAWLWGKSGRGFVWYAAFGREWTQQHTDAARRWSVSRPKWILLSEMAAYRTGKLVETKKNQLICTFPLQQQVFYDRMFFKCVHLTVDLHRQYSLAATYNYFVNYRGWNKFTLPPTEIGLKSLRKCSRFGSYIFVQ